VVQVVDVGYRPGPASQRWVLHWIDDALSTEPNLTMVAQALEKLGAGAGWHQMVPLAKQIADHARLALAAVFSAFDGATDMRSK
jgi:hypothetical protein